MIIRILPSALCLLLAPLMVAEQVHNDAQTAVGLDRATVTETQSASVLSLKIAPVAASAMQSTPASAAPMAGNAIDGQYAKTSLKSKKHHVKRNISTALKRTGEVLAFIALLPLTLPLAIVWIVALLIDCRQGCDP